MKTLGVALFATCLVGCVSANSPPTAGGRRVTYSCDRGPGLAITYAGDIARIENGNGQTLLLQRKKTDAGFWYESATHRLRGRGNMVTFALAYTPQKTCRTS